MRDVRRSSHAFMFLELLSIIAIIALLAAMLLSASSRARLQARRARCQGNLHQISLALDAYAQDYHCYPPAVIPLDWEPDIGDAPPAHEGWPKKYCILPYVLGQAAQMPLRDVGRCVECSIAKYAYNVDERTGRCRADPDADHVQWLAACSPLFDEDAVAFPNKGKDAWLTSDVIAVPEPPYFWPHISSRLVLYSDGRVDLDLQPSGQPNVAGFAPGER